MLPFTKINRHISEHGVFSLLIFFLDYLRNQLVINFVFGGSKPKNIYIGANAILRGAKLIHLGNDFFAKDMLWLDAIERFGQQRFSPIIEIGRGVSISRNVHIAAINHIKIGDDVLIGSNVLITDHSHGESRSMLFSDLAPALRPLVSKGPVIIGKNVWIGDGAVILGGVCIGAGAVIGANAVVTKNIPDMTIVAGIPAQRI